MKLRSNLTISPLTLLPLRGLRRIILLTVLLLAACAPATVPNPVGPEISTPLAPIENASVASPTPTPTEILPQADETKILPTKTPTEVPQVVATSRGPNLEATDPSTYTRTAGEIQLVEFFAFW